MNDAITACDSAIESGDASSVPDTILSINPDYRDAQFKKIGLTNGDTTKQVIQFIIEQKHLSYCLFLLEWIQ